MLIFIYLTFETGNSLHLTRKCKSRICSATLTPSHDTGEGLVNRQISRISHKKMSFTGAKFINFDEAFNTAPSANCMTVPTCRSELCSPGIIILHFPVVNQD